ncbi:MAG TPA: 3-hydroxyacyl-CoA dehydrogenase family protein [Actinomycetota bacterium]|nr:3-hydroxyacyl-CoA dehydrogenase family protein [Actinomycetota bacterium]
MATPERIGLFGTGVMARGIAELCLSNAISVVVRSASPERAESFAASLDGAVVSTDPGDLEGCALFLEATVEAMEPKTEALCSAERLLPPDAVIASTTSSLSITALAAALQGPERMIGLHFFNPVARMPLVEVVAGIRTEPAAVARGRELAHALGKRPLTVPDGAGFLVNRLLIPYLNQAARLAESGYATAEDIDQAMTLGTGHPMGPFALIDLIGADVVEAIGLSLEDHYHRTSDGPPPELKRRVALGWLGRKTRQGYFPYPPRRS